MTISPFGVFIIIYTLYVFAKRNLKKCYYLLWKFALLTEGVISAGFFIRIGDISISPGLFFQVLLFLVAFFVRRNNRERKDRQLIFIFVLLVIINVGMLAIDPLKELVRSYGAADRSLEYYSIEDIYIYPSVGMQTITTALMFVLFVINALSFSSYISEEEWKKIEYGYIRIWKYLLYYLLFEFITKNIFHWYGYVKLLDWFFGADGVMVYVSSVSRSGLLVLIGLNVEPSHLLMLIIPFLFVYVLSDYDEKKGRKKNAYIILTFILSVLSGSFRAVGMIPIIFLLMIIEYKPNGKIVASFSLLLITGFLLESLGLLESLERRLSSLIATVTNYNAGSYFAEGRVNTIIEAFGIFIKRPLFGCGLGTAFAYGFIPSALETFGLIGTMYWYRIMFFRVGNIRRIRNGRKYMILLTIMWFYTNAISTGYMGTTLILCLSIAFYRDKLVYPEKNHRKE